MSFQAKRALASLIAIWISAAGYAGSVLRSWPQTPGEAALSIVTAAIGLTVLMILMNILLAIITGAEEARRPLDEAGRLIALEAGRNASLVVGLGLFLAGALALLSMPSVLIAQAAMAALLLAEIVRYTSQLISCGRASYMAARAANSGV